MSKGTEILINTLMKTLGINGDDVKSHVKKFEQLVTSYNDAINEINAGITNIQKRLDTIEEKMGMRGK